VTRPRGTVVVVNPTASRLRNPEAREALIKELVAALTSRHGVAPEVHESGDLATMRALLAEARNVAPEVIAVGGDGTVMEVATAMAGSAIPVGIVPAGTGNILAGTLGIPGSPRAAVRALARAVPRRMDLGEASWELAAPSGGATAEANAAPVIERAGRRAFGVGCGLGFDAHLMMATLPGLKRAVGRAAYFATAVTLVPRLRTVPFSITIDGETMETEATVALLVNCGELLPGLLRPRLPVSSNDGELDLFVLRASTPFHGLRAALDLLGRTSLGEAPSGVAFRAMGRSFRLASTPPEPLQIDGEPFGFGSITASVLPGALSVLVPDRA
jgi:diacylglycerol kinase (ATP)